MKIAAIDIGTNAIRAKIFRTNPVSIEFMEQFRYPLRLGSQVYKEGKLSRPEIEKLIEVVNDCVDIFKAKEVARYEIIATSALRDTQNSEAARRKIEIAINHPVRIISGLEEANLIRFHPRSFTGDKKLFVDIGGGSTEFFIRNDTETNIKSFQLGGVRNMLNKDKKKEWERMREWLQSIAPRRKLIGIGGNIRSFLQMSGGKEIRTETVIKNIAALSNLSVDEKVTAHGFSPDRADVIDHALEILRVISKELNVESVTSTKWGITDAIAVRLFHEIYANKANLTKDKIGFPGKIA